MSIHMEYATGDSYIIAVEFIIICITTWYLKVCSYIHEVVAGRRGVDFDISTWLLRASTHIGGWMAEHLEWICHVCEGRSRIGVRGFKADTENWMFDQFLAKRILLPLHFCFATAYVWTHVMIYVEANFPLRPSASALRICECTLMLIIFVTSWSCL